jgi:hypothetical protein
MKSYQLRELFPTHSSYKKEETIRLPKISPNKQNKTKNIRILENGTKEVKFRVRSSPI